MVKQDRKNLIDLTYDDKDAKWSLAKLEAFTADNKPKDEKLEDTEELASGKLNDLRNALGDLKIIDVARKPSGFSAELKAEEKFTSDPEAVASMQQRGFLPLKSGEILSTDGETTVGMKDGVEYVLRFGAGTTVAGESAATESGKPGDEAAAGETAGRYLLVMAKFNEGLLEKPTLESLPEAAGEKEALKEVAKDGNKPAEDEVTKEKPADEKAAESLKQADEAEAKAQAALEERRRVERENKRKQDAFDEQVKVARKRVRDLNNRFADWYYVVSNKEYAKIHLGREGIAQKKTEAAEAPK